MIAPIRSPSRSCGAARRVSRALATAAANTATYANVRPASTYVSSGTIDHSTDAAVRSASSANSNTVVVP